jgi:hypothetical protein
VRFEVSGKIETLDPEVHRSRGGPPNRVKVGERSIKVVPYEQNPLFRKKYIGLISRLPWGMDKMDLDPSYLDGDRLRKSTGRKEGENLHGTLRDWSDSRAERFFLRKQKPKLPCPAAGFKSTKGPVLLEKLLGKILVSPDLGRCLSPEPCPTYVINMTVGIENRPDRPGAHAPKIILFSKDSIFAHPWIHNNISFICFDKKGVCELISQSDPNTGSNLYDPGRFLRGTKKCSFGGEANRRLRS